MNKNISISKQSVGTYLFVELQRDTLKMLATETSQKGKTTLTRCIVRRFEKDPPGFEEILDFLKSTLKGWKLKSARCHVSIPMNNVLMHSPSLPSHDPSEIQGMIDFFIQDKLPYEENDIVSDYRVHLSVESGFSAVSLFAVHHDVIREALSAPQGADDLPITHVELSLEGILSLFMKSPQYKEYGDQDTIWIMDVDHDHCDIMLVTKKELVYARHIPVGYVHAGSDYYGTDHLYREIWQTIMAYDHKILMARPTAIVLSGARKGCTIMKDVLVGKLEELGLRQVHELDKGMLRHPLFDPFTEDYSLSSILGFATDRLRPKISFIPDEIRMQESLHEKGQQLSRCIFLAFCLVFSLGAVFVEKVYESMVIRDQLEQEITLIDLEAQSLEKLVEETRVSKGLKDRRSSVINYLRELHVKTTSNITIEVLVFSKERANRMTVKGLASSTSDVFKFVEALQASEEFFDVETKYTTKKKSSDKEVEKVQFEVIASLNINSV